MMRKIVITTAMFLGIVGGYYGLWRWLLSDDVARINATIAFHNQQFKTANRYVTLKADSVAPAGFPLHFRVRVVRPTLSMIFDRETYAISYPMVELESQNAAQGRYRVRVPATAEALYAIDGKAPEHYTVSFNPIPGLLLRAQGDSSHCSPFPGGQACPDAKPDDPLVTYALQLPKTIIAHITLNGESRDVAFDTLSFTVPLFVTIPTAIDRALQLAVGVLREAMVFKTK